MGSMSITKTIYFPEPRTDKSGDERRDAHELSLISRITKTSYDGRPETIHANLGQTSEVGEQNSLSQTVQGRA